MNVIALMGRLTHDPKLTYTPTGKCLCQTSIAVRRDFSKENVADFFQLEAWEKPAEIISKWFVKGSRIAVQGRLQNNFYEGKNGVKQYAQKIIVDRIDFVDCKKDSEQSNEGVDDYGFNGTPVNSDDFPF